MIFALAGRRDTRPLGKLTIPPGTQWPHAVRDRMLPKSRLVGGGERVGAVVARGELEIGFQQMSELLPVAGLDHINPLPPEAQKVSSFAAGVGANSPNPALARSVIQFLLSPEAAAVIAKTGLEPAGSR